MINVTLLYPPTAAAASYDVCCTEKLKDVNELPVDALKWQYDITLSEKFEPVKKLVQDVWCLRK